MTDTPRVERYVIRGCECGERWLTAKGKCWTFDDTGRGCDGERVEVETVSVEPLSQLVSEWEARAEESDRRWPYNADAGPLRSCARRRA